MRKYSVLDMTVVGLMTAAGIAIVAYLGLCMAVMCMY